MAFAGRTRNLRVLDAELAFSTLKLQLMDGTMLEKSLRKKLEKEHVTLRKLSDVGRALVLFQEDSDEAMRLAEAYRRRGLRLLRRSCC